VSRQTSRGLAGSADGLGCQPAAGRRSWHIGHIDLGKKAGLQEQGERSSPRVGRTARRSKEAAEPFRQPIAQTALAQFMLLVMCEEQQQLALLERFKCEGLAVKVLLS
jgi:hypothetical protein